MAPTPEDIRIASREFDRVDGLLKKPDVTLSDLAEASRVTISYLRELVARHTVTKAECDAIHENCPANVLLSSPKKAAMVEVARAGFMGAGWVGFVVYLLLMVHGK